MYNFIHKNSTYICTLHIYIHVRLDVYYVNTEDPSAATAGGGGLRSADRAAGGSERKYGGIIWPVIRVETGAS